MQCEDIQQQLEKLSGDSSRLPQNLLDHVQTCDNCKDYAEQLQVADMLQGMPGREASQGFADRAMENAWNKAHGNTKSSTFSGARLATAAVLILAIFMGLQLQFGGNEIPQGLIQQDVKLVSGSSRTLDLIVSSGLDYPDAEIKLAFDEGVQLTGYPKQTTVSWKTQIMSGNNQLSLPVELVGVNAGDIRVTITSGNASKEMLISVKAADAGEYAMSLIVREQKVS